jgi:hypothetical protein
MNLVHLVVAAKLCASEEDAIPLYALESRLAAQIPMVRAVRVLTLPSVSVATPDNRQSTLRAGSHALFLECPLNPNRHHHRADEPASDYRHERACHVEAARLIWRPMAASFRASSSSAVRAASSRLIAR